MCSQPTFEGSSKILFLSDVHLGAFSKSKNRQLEDEVIQLIQFAQQQNYSIAILGDLFDYWIEYTSSVPSLGKDMLEHFKIFNRQRPSLYITGNHDNWTIGHFRNLGFDVETDYRLYTVGGKNVLLAHGDATGANLDSLERPFWHRVIRNKIFLKIYRGLFSPEIGLYLMRKCSDVNRQSTDSKNGCSKLDDWAQTILNNNSIDVLICGHDHIPRTHAYAGGNYINAGAFYNHRTLIQYNNGNFNLVSWNNQKSDIVPFQPHELTYE